MSNKLKTKTMTPESKRVLKPKLRFPEFQGEPEWTAEKLGAVASLITEKAGDKKCIPMSITSGVGLVSQQEKFGRTIAGDQYENYLVLQKNDFAYNKSATKQFPQGFIAKYSGDEPAAVPNSIFTCFRARKDGIVPDFLNYLFVGNLHGKWLQKYIEVSARAHGSLSIDDEDLLSLPIPLPSGESSRTEQQKIAACLTSLDELIDVHGQKLDALKAHKKGLTGQLFPSEGEPLPRLRFPEFQDAAEWERKTLNDIAEISSGTTPARSNPEFFEGGSIPWVKTMDLNNSFIIETEEKITPKARARINPAGSVLVAMYGGFNQIGRTGCLSVPAATNQAISVLVLDNKVALPAYVLAWMNAKVDDWKRIASSSRKDPNITGSDVANFSISLPEIQEQQKIADNIFSLDDLITAQTRKLDTLKTHKKGMMQQLFPSPEKVEA
jgi:type I restriction enzyme S subunit